MQQVFRDRKGKVTVEDLPVPVVSKGKVLVKVAYSLISSGTEARTLQTTQADFSKKVRNPGTIARVLSKVKTQGIRTLYRNVKAKLEARSPLGYSCAGVVVEKAEDVVDVSKGDLVACMSAEYAYHAGYVVVPRNLIAKVPKGVDAKEACFVTLGCIAMHAVRNARVQVGDFVAVVGLGLIGQIVMQLLKLSGVRVIGIDTVKERVSLAKRCGLDQGIVLKEEGNLAEVQELSNGLGVDASILCTTGTQHGIIEKVADSCRDRARFVVVGSVDLQIPYGVFYRKELELVVSRSTGPGRYDEAFESLNQQYPVGYVRWTERRNAEEFMMLLAVAKVDVRPLISEEYKVEHAEKAYESLLKGVSLGIVLKYSNEDQERMIRTIEVTPIKSNKERLAVGVIGLGVFANNVLLPEITKNKGYALHTVVSRTSVQAKEVARKFSAAYCSTDYKEVLGNQEVDIVMIATRNNTHAKLAVEAAGAKKNIFLEKPMAMNYAEMEKIIDAVRKNKVFFTLGLNRRFAPLALVAKEVVKQLRGPLMIQYRFNDERKADRAWVEDRVEGGGRVLHLCNHMIDFCCWLTDADPVDVFTKSVRGGEASVVDQDNVTMISNLSDGSLATMTYSSLGNSALDRERIEILCDNKVIVINDFQSIEFFGISKSGMVLPEPDKGYKNQFDAVRKCLQGDASAQYVTISDAVRSQVFCLRALESLSEKKVLPVDYKKFLEVKK